MITGIISALTTVFWGPFDPSQGLGDRVKIIRVSDFEGGGNTETPNLREL